MSASHSLMHVQSRTPTNDNQESNWIKSVRRKLGINECIPPNFTIQRIPDKLRKVNKDAYSPRIVSIGPFHWGQAQLRAMDQCKWRYMKIYPSPSATFILELLLRCWDKNFRYDNDPIISNAWLMPFLRHDLSLLENQIPLMVLEELYNIIKPLIIIPQNYSNELPRSVTCLALHFFHKDFNQLVNQDKYIFGSDCKHLLHLLHKWYLSTNVSVDAVLDLSPIKGYGLLPVPKSKARSGFKFCATELLAAGIEFGPGHSKKLLKIKFTREKGELRIPTLCIHETTETLNRNLIAFEQCTSQVTHRITSYVALMRSLIHCPEDVKLLQSKGIIVYNNSCEAKDVVQLFNSILKEVVPGKFHFVELIHEVDSYYQEWWRWHRIKAVCRVRFHENMRIFGSSNMTMSPILGELYNCLLLLRLLFLQPYKPIIAFILN